MNNLSKVGFLIILSSTLCVFLDAFELGTSRSYLLTNDVQINDLITNGVPSQYQLTGNLKLDAIWESNDEKLFKFELTSPKLFLRSDNSINPNDFEFQQSKLDKYQTKPFYIHWKDGKIVKFFCDQSEDVYISNLKKGIASLFQYKLLDGQFIEEDVSGKCDVIYRSKTSTQYIKTKLKCTTDYDIDYRRRLEKPFGIFIDAQRSTIYDVTADGTVDKIQSTEFYKTYLNANKKIGTTTESILELHSVGEIRNIDTISGSSLDDIIKSIKNLKEDHLVSEHQHLNKKEKSLIKLIKQHKKNLSNENVGKEELALAVIQLLDASNGATVDDLLRILNARTTQDHKGQFLDILAATQTMESFEAVRKNLNFKLEKDFVMTERYFQSLAVAPRPNEKIIEELLLLTKMEFEEAKLFDTLIQTIASMAKRFTQIPEHSFESTIVRKVEQHLLTFLPSCKTAECKVIYIRGLQNLGSPRTIMELFQIIFREERVVTISAAKALRSFEIQYWTKEHIKLLNRIFYQLNKRYDSTVRTIALDILFSMEPSHDELKQLLEFLKSNDKDFEVKQYLLQRVQMLSSECVEFKNKIDKIIRSDSSLNNYNIFAQDGLSTALSRKFSKSPSFNATLLSIQEMSGGVLKSGLVDLSIESDHNKFSIFSLGMYAGGLSSFVGGSSDENDEEDTEPEQPNAGMEIIVQGAYMRPLQFFHGQGELMGHVWSGTAAEPTPAYQGTTLLQDHFEYLRLQNGAIIIVNVVGTISIDLNGQIKISIWNRSAHSKVEQNTAFATEGQISLITSFITLKTEYSVVQAPKLDLTTDINFSSKPMLCMQLSQPNSILRHNILNSIEVPKFVNKNGKLMKYMYNIPGQTYSLNHKNNEMCNEILNY